MVRRARDAQREPFARHLIGPRRFAVGVQQDVRVSFDEARRQRRARQIDRFRAGRGNARVGPDGVDALAFDAHRPAFVHRVAVEDACRLQHGDRSRRCCARPRCSAAMPSGVRHATAAAAAESSDVRMRRHYS